MRSARTIDLAGRTTERASVRRMADDLRTGRATAPSQGWTRPDASRNKLN